MNDITAQDPLVATPSSAPDQEEQIVQWLRLYIADVLGVPPERINTEASFQQLGLDSSAAVGMTGDLGEWLGREIDAAAAYDHPSIQALAHALAKEI
ncbi:acyl carrier protein [Burkholderia sp. FERM BP-3421]|jgi:acyl carrier protein|uniref:acyl carrier protein n=1 Tax=Burkholderia sp. FERM BP-3421 TaxID=1494466 RepID=UPI0023611802|nr:acyl carrier protein [Burkholderia sp. FERM BP-3421]WDD95769.1 acyl carrier protein [Burkholderia sp. FERM BP-3421]